MGHSILLGTLEVQVAPALRRGAPVDLESACVCVCVFPVARLEDFELIDMAHQAHLFFF